MKIAVLGATGNIGQHFVTQALAKGHSITALVRSPPKLTIEHHTVLTKRGAKTFIAFWLMSAQNSLVMACECKIAL